jgi:N-acetylneuraminate synthase
MNLRTIVDMAERFLVPVGLSDHTMGTAVSVTAVAAGACIIEKHLTISRAQPGPDSAFSLEPWEFRVMVDAVRETEKALGEIRYQPTENEKSARVFRRSLFIVKDVKAGEPFTQENVRSIRPAHGLSPRFLGEVVGRHAARDLAKGTPLAWSDVA